MELKLSTETRHRVEEASHLLGLEESELVNQAVLLYLDVLRKNVDLKKELKAWEALSDEAWTNFEKTLRKSG